MDSGVIGWLLVLGMIVVLPLWFDHRQKMAKLTGGKSDPDEKLLARIDALEKKCEKLQEQVNEAHQLLVDERRLLDQKLASVLPSMPSTTDAASQKQAPVPVRTL